MRAVVIDPNVPVRLAIRDVEMPSPGPSEALVKVAATSLNYGEIHMAQSASAGSRIGWDAAGIIEKAAQDGSGPPVGARVVAFLPTATWAEYIAAPTNAIAQIPDKVSFAQAATLPVAGLTAMHAVAKGEDILRRKVLITGASGGVGHFACQIAKLSGATVVAQVRRDSERDLVLGLGVDYAVASEDGSAAGDYGPYSLIVDGVGGKVLSNAMGMLTRDGICVVYGATGGVDVTFNIWAFVGPAKTRLYGLIMGTELSREPASEGLARLAGLMADGLLRPHISVEAPFDKIAETAQALMDRKIRGKAVIRLIAEG
jgi:NADPH:quinone reductase